MQRSSRVQSESNSLSRVTSIRKSRLFRTFYWVLAALFVTSLFAYLAVKAIFDIYGQITLTPVLFHLTAGGEAGVSWEVVELFLPWVLKSIVAIGFVCFFAWAFIRFDTISQVFVWVWRKISKIPGVLFLNRVPVFLAVVVFLVLPAYWGHSIDRKLKIVEFFSQEESLWIEEHFARLDLSSGGFVDEDKPNLIILFIESMEQGYVNEKIFSKNLIPELQAIRNEGISFRGYRRTPGSAFTMDGLSAQLIGVPVVASRLGLDLYRNKQGYGSLLRNASSIFNMLEHQGWRTAAFTGASERFTMKGDFFRMHGVNEIFSREYFNQQGYREEGVDKGPWGYNDSFLYQRLKDWLTEVSKDDRPFAVVMETIDTHTPEGFVSNERVRFRDGRDAVVESSKMAKNFIDWAKTQSWYENTVIYIAGDHPWQDWNGSSLTRFMDNLSDREIFNVVLNSRVQSSKEGKIIVVPGGWSAMDIAPTLLDSMGLRFESVFIDGKRSDAHLGLGTSLYKASDPNSGVKTWVAHEGEERFTEELQKPSRFYDSLF